MKHEEQQNLTFLANKQVVLFYQTKIQYIYKAMHSSQCSYTTIYTIAEEREITLKYFNSNNINTIKLC